MEMGSRKTRPAFSRYSPRDEQRESYASHPWPHTLFICGAQFFLYRSIRSIRITITSFIYITHTLHSCKHKSISFFIFIYTNVVYYIINTGVKFSVSSRSKYFDIDIKKRTPAGVLVIYSIVLLWLTPTGTHLLTFLSEGKLIGIILILESYHSTIINHLNLIDRIFYSPVVRQKPIIDFTYKKQLI